MPGKSDAESEQTPNKNNDAESEQTTSKIREIELKQKFFSWVGSGALIVSTFLTWTGIIQPPSRPFSYKEETTIEQTIKRLDENTEATKKQAEAFNNMAEGIAKLNETLAKQKPTPMPTPTIIVPSK